MHSTNDTKGNSNDSSNAHNLDSIDAMSGFDVARALAVELMGWTLRPSCWPKGSLNPVAETWIDPSNKFVTNSYVAWRPDKDRHYLHEVLKRCESLGIGGFVLDEFFRDSKGDDPRADQWALLTCCPEKLCRVILRVARKELPQCSPKN